MKTLKDEIAEAKRYNGYTNYETWCVSLWLAQDPADCAAACAVIAGGTIYEAGEALKDHVKENHIPHLDAGMAADMLNASLSEVNWAEIAEGLRSE